MTASLAAVLVEEGKIKWETTVAEIFPAFRGRMNEAWKAVTLEQLLTNRSGAPGDAPADLWWEAWKQTGSPTIQRLAFVGGLVARAPEAQPGTKFIYSNQGFAIAGAMLEKVAGKPFEKLMAERLFAPLGLTTAGFGAPGDARRVDQPWGHTGTNRKPVPPGPAADNPPAITPAGRVHLSIADYLRYAGWHAGGAMKGKALLSDASFAKLHTAVPGQDYAMGWGVGEHPSAGGKVLIHNGSNTMWYAKVWVAPGKNAAIVVATNFGGDAAEQGCDEALSALIQKLVH
jgi:CubicO group peptidase (beta-lactamase class C family)